MDNSVKEIEVLVEQLKSKQKRIEELEYEVKSIKQQKKELEEVTIPETMSELGVQSVTLLSHEVVTIKPFYYARLPENPEPFFKWLRDNEFGGLIKEKVEAYPGEKAELLLDFLNQFEINYESNSTVHWKTLEAWFKECRESGLVLSTDLFPHYEGRKAQVKG